MRKIKKLSDSIINMIAAGEVVERPASVIKELIENSVDAGSTEIIVRVEASGKNFISISDNGHGMSPEDIALAVQRHTTSKLNEDDISNIEFFGFRGEALPSIASVSNMNISSRQKNTEYGFSFSFSGGVLTSENTIDMNYGTIIEISDLFFTTPARLKFLKSDKTELASCIDVVKRMALSYPQISFSFWSDGKELLKFDSAESYISRIDKILGADFAKNSSEIFLLNDDYKITGFTSIPTHNRSSNSDQFLFVNNRPVKDKLLNIALKVAYQDYLAKDRHPISVIYIDANPRYVDVNVHPAKTEVRFREAGEIRSMLISSIKEALRKTSSNTSSLLSEKFLSSVSNPLPQKKLFEKNETYNSPIDPYQKTNISRNIYQPAKKQAIFSRFDLDIKTPEIKAEKTTIIQETPSDWRMGAAVSQIHNCYILSQTNDGLIIVDQHAAHERIIYEKIKKDLLNGKIPSQRLIIPEIIEFENFHLAELLFEQSEKLAEFGLVIQKAQESTIIVREVPAILGEFNVKKLIWDLAENFADLGENFALQELIEHVTETYACHHSIRSGRSLDISEMNDLLRQMEETPFSGQCNHGRPTYVELKLSDIEKLFGRK